MVFSAVIIRVSNDHSAKTMSAANGFKLSISNGTRRSRQTATGNGFDMGPHGRADGVQITLDTITHRDKDVSEFAFENGSNAFSPDKVDGLA